MIKQLFGGVLLAFVGQVGAQEVHVLTDSNFKTFLEEHSEGALVEFYAPWCGHCKALEPEYNAAAKQLHEDKVKIPLGKVDATVESTLAQKFDVRGYPTLKYFVGGEPSEYDGPREAKGIVDWVKGMSGPAVIEGAPKGDETVSVTLYAKEASESFDKAAKANRKKAAWHFVQSDSEHKVVVKHSGEAAIEESEDMDLMDFAKFYQDNAFPSFGQLNGDTFGQYMEKGNGLIWALFKMEDKDKAEEVVAAQREKFIEFAGSEDIKTDYSVAWTNTAEFGKVLENMFGITEFPRLVVQKKAGDKKSFIYKPEGDELTAEGMKKFIADVKEGKVEPNLKSEPVPEEPQSEPVKVVVGKSLQEQIFHKTRDAMLEIYAPWCGHCKKLEPEYTKIAKKVIKEGVEDLVYIAKLDGTTNDSPVDSISWSGFPTIYYVKAGSDAPMKYEDGRDAKSIWKWIKKNSSHADEIKKRMEEKRAAPKEEKKAEL